MMKITKAVTSRSGFPIRSKIWIT